MGSLIQLIHQELISVKKIIPHPHLGDAKFFVQLPQIQLLFILKNQPYWIPKRLQDISTPYFSTPSSILATTWTLQTMNSSNHVFLNHELFNHELLNPLELWIFSTMNSGLEESRVEVWCWKVKCWNVLSLLGRRTFQSPNGRKIHSLKNYGLKVHVSRVYGLRVHGSRVYGLRVHG